MMYWPKTEDITKTNDMKKAFLIFVLQLLTFQGFCQHEQSDGHEHLQAAPFHKITLVTANSLINNIVDENSNSLLLVPVFGFNYDYFFHKNWGIGLHNDLVLQQFKVERHHNEQELIRENPVAVCGIISFKPHHRWILFGGYGVELEKNENISLFRFGVEYGIELNNNWELGFNAEYDYKIKAYSSFMVGVGFSKILFKEQDK
jgi:hypothetical protein